MSKLIIKGKQRLGGKVSVQGAKNSALPILAATVLTRGESLIFNCPMLSDVEASVRILRYLGCVASREGSTLVINSDGVCRSDIPDGLMRKMRSSIVFLGAVLARTGSARLSFPGGCEIGPRPIDIHLCALREMGAVIKEKHGYLDCTAPDGLKGCKLSLSFPSVGATEDIMLAGAKIYGAGEGVVVIDGVDSLNGACHTIIPDRIAAATLMSCAAVTGSRIALTDVIGSQLASVIPVFEEAGCTVLCQNGEIDFRAPQRLDSMRIIRTMPYPGFPTDAQAPLMAAACVAKGTTVFIENIFENRYRHTSELIRMGANIRTEGKFAVVEGVDALYGAAVEATDLRGAASLVAAGLCAEQKTEISGIKYLERGYENLELTLSSLGADIKKI